MLNFRLLGIPVQIQLFFWLIMAFLGFMMTGADMDNFGSTALIKILIFIAAGFISILVHEFGHALTMKQYGRRPQIVLHGMGGVAMSSGTPFTRAQDILVSVMGPVAQLILGGIAFLALKYIPEFPGQTQDFIKYLYLISCFWAIINLIPMFPLDGGQILLGIIGNKKTVHIVGIAIGVCLIGFMLMKGMTSLWNFLIIAMLIRDNITGMQRS